MPIMRKNVGDDRKELLRTAQELADRVAENADRIDCERQIPAELAGEIADRGFFRLLLPRFDDVRVCGGGGIAPL